MSHAKMRAEASRIEDVSLVILLPLFFAFTALKTQIGLLNDSATWFVCGLIILVAVAGKVVGSVAAAKFTGQSWSDSFTMMVLMALVTTFMTSPALSAIQYFSGKREMMSVYPAPDRMWGIPYLEWLNTASMTQCRN